MAKHLARIHGTEEDRVNCPFYFKIGACRHSDRCSRLHHRPAFSPTLLIKHIYRHPVRLAELQQAATAGETVIDQKQAMEDFLCFYEDMFLELSKFGRIDELHVCDNLGDHMIGHVYCKFFNEEDASDALQVMNGRFYDGRRMEVEFSPVTDFREARCRDYDETFCSRGGFCNFLHSKPVPTALIRDLELESEMDRRREKDERRDKDREERRARKRERRERREKKRSRKSSRRSRSRSRSRSSRSHSDESDDSRSH
ncbi:zinc finger domain containing protein [Nitzschia inconspicua]|uniref:Zinc finger domain containing protein n=1 Tax=Nitzschia inconspicua TaxID=303405 RepID=A0A9K3KS68_9STRA|nr:zinc finger domain containing protein [Nitzschia inconspicua]